MAGLGGLLALRDYLVSRMCPSSASLISRCEIDWLDGGMITLAMYTMNLLHPGRLLGRDMGLSERAPSADTSDAGSDKEATS